MRMPGLRTAGLMAAVAALAASPSVALPGDPAIEPLTPADGATVPADPAGIPVTFTCPAYLVSGGPFADRGDHEDYDVVFSDSPAIGARGRLASQPWGNSASARLNADGTTCTAVLDTPDAARSPEIAGGTIHWQVSRSCTGCEQYGREFSPVRSFTVRPARVTGSLAVTGRPYAGFPVLVTLSTRAALSGGTVALERRVGSRWRPVDSTRFDADGTPFVASLPAGRQVLRARVGGITIAGRTVTVLRPGRRATSARDDGAYGPRAAAPNATLRMRVAGGGTRVTAFRASVAVLCPGAGVGDARFTIAFATLASAKVAPDGRVAARTTTAAGTEVRLTGRLAARRFTGAVALKLGGCSGSRAIVATRR